MTRTIALAALCSAIASAQTIEVKLYHPAFRVTDMDAAKRLFSGLGFIISGSPTRSACRFPGSGGFEFSENHDLSEGLINADLEIVSADEAARALRAAGLRIVGPTPGSRQLSTGATLKWFTLRFEDKLDSRPVYMVQGLNLVELLGNPDSLPNSVSSLSALLVAVNDLDKAAAGYVNIGTLSTREVAFPEFGAIAKEIVLARGSIFLLRATDPSGPTAQRLKTRGEGILGVRLAVTDLDQTRKLIGEKNISKDKQTVLVSPENAAGAWLEFQRP
jgi:catechol 2,3-dioxygenase-like lactoylglutathione lyase family enzyme